VVCFVFRIVWSVWYVLILELFGQCGMFCLGIVWSVWYVLFLELFGQCGMFWFYNCLVSVVCFVFRIVWSVWYVLFLELFGQCGMFDQTILKTKHTTLTRQF
jgi:hypothetical protein